MEARLPEASWNLMRRFVGYSQAVTLYRNFRWGFDGQVQSMLVENGRVVERAPDVYLEGAEAVDLSGQWVMPAFVDNHCHIIPMGLDLQKLHLGACSTREEVLDAVRLRIADLDEGRWLHAVHYDQTKFIDGDHLTCHDLDKISDSVPILLRHVNGHASIANSAALKAAGVNPDQADPEGGTFRRDERGAIDGVLLESAHELVTNASPKPTLQEMTEAILLAGEKKSQLGIACASDMMTGRFNLMEELQAYYYASQIGCGVRIRLYLQWSEVFGRRALPREEIEGAQSVMNSDLCRIAGIKIFADGAIGSATAAIYGHYSGVPANGPIIAPNRPRLEGEEVSGILNYSPAKLTSMVETAHQAGYQVAIHSIGDYATDLVMDAFAATGEAERHRIEHAMILSDAQIERMAELGCYCTMQPEFLMRFEHSYARQLGPMRAARLKRTRSVIDAGIPLSFSSDRPIVAGDPRDGIETAVTRPSLYDQEENITREEAWRAYTEEGARANGDGTLMGALLPGQLADFQVLDDNPL